jgi:hypothetical protein
VTQLAWFGIGFLTCTFYIGVLIYVAEKPNRRRLRSRPRLRVVDASGSVQELPPLDARPFVPSERSRIALQSLTIQRWALGMSGRRLLGR